MKILQDVERLKKKSASFKQSVFKAEINVKEHALKRAFIKFLEKAYSKLQESNSNKKRDEQYCKYWNWWRENQIWVLLYNAFDAAVLLFISKDQRVNELYSINNQQ